MNNKNNNSTNRLKISKDNLDNANNNSQHKTSLLMITKY